MFKRLGHIFGGLADVQSIQGGPTTTAVGSGASWATRGTTIEADAAESPEVSPQVDGHWGAITSWRSAQSALFAQMRSYATAILIRQVDLDSPLPSKDVTLALTELIRQMKANNDSFGDSTVSAGSQTAVGSPTGTLKIVCAVTNRNGFVVQTPFPETLHFSVISDSQSNTATARNEGIKAQGAASISDVSAYNWPGGSGSTTSLSVTDQQANNAKGNLLQNSSFDVTTTANSPDNLIFPVGVAGVNFFSSTSSYSTGKALQITGDVGNTIVTWRQTFNTTTSTTFGSGGTPGKLEPNQQYALGMWMKRDNSLSAGALTCSLLDGSNTVVADVAGNNSTFTQSLTGLTGTYAFFSGVLRTPATVPASGFKLEMKTSTAIDSGDSLFIDDVALVKMTPLYNGGPSVAIFSGSTAPVIGDVWTIAISSSMAGFASWMERIFLLRDKNLQFPYVAGGGETVSDTLIV